MAHSEINTTFTRKCIQYIRNYNFFPSQPPSTDQYELKNQRISTRLFIILLIVFFAILLLYNSLVTVTKVTTIESPSINQYSKLYSEYSQTLTCPCKQISINQDTLLNLTYTLHQVCYSQFITQDWIDYLREARGYSIMSTDDFRAMSINHFQALTTLCGLTNITISNSLTQFYATQYVSLSVTPKELFDVQVQSLVNQYKSSTTNNFLTSMRIIRDMTQSNFLFSSLFTNARIYIDEEYISTSPRLYSDCSCGTTYACVAESRMYNGTSLEVLFIVPGMRIGCFVVESLLASTLECFYNQTCFNALKFMLNGNLSLNISILNSSSQSQFSTSSKIQEIVNMLMVEEWNLSPTYADYYNECDPIECTYTENTRNDALFIITTLIGLVGGLVTVLKVVVPMIVKLVRRKKTETTVQTAAPIRRPFRAYLHQGVQYIRNYNFFPSQPPSTDQYELKNQRISTRLFIVSLIVSLAILLLYNSLVTVTKVTTITSPSINQYSKLYYKYSQTLTCPCKQISINQDKLLNLTYTLHQVCYSQFITQDWIDYLHEARGSSDMFADDFRVTGIYHFQALTALCGLTNITISNSLTQFYATQYVSLSVTPKELFDVQVQSLVNQYKSSTTNNFLTSMRIIRDMTQSNFLFSSLFTNAGIYLDEGYILAYPVFYSDCFCGTTYACVDESRMYNGTSYEVLFTAPGMRIGCFVVESLLASTLECFYNQTCFNALKFMLNGNLSLNISILNSSSQSQFSTRSKIQEIVNMLMVEEWNLSPTYADYYNQCDPIECTYTENTRNDALFIITTLIGLVGGLVTVLKVAVPMIVKLVRRKKAETTAQTDLFHKAAPIRRPFRAYLHQGVQCIRNYNFFPSQPPSTDQYELKNQRISTRLFIALLIVSLAILLLYNSLVTVTKVTTITSPSINQYSKLYSKYSQTLTCPCKQISINQDKLLNLTYTLHQVCYSQFITQDWIDYIYETWDTSALATDDFRVTSIYHFQALTTLCGLTDITISNSLTQFYATQYVSLSVTPKELFDLQVQSLVNQYKSSTTNNFLTSMRLIRDMTQRNSLFSSLFTNAGIYIDEGDVITYPLSYSDCFCRTSYACVEESRVFNGISLEVLFIVPGMRIGCFVVESLLASTLECFYNQTCFNALKFMLNGNLSLNISILNSSSQSQFSTSSKIEEIVNMLMVEEWNLSPTYADYYNQCDPIECTYTENTRNDALFIITTLIGLVGGLVTALKLIVPLIVRVIRYIRRRMRRVSPG